MSAPTRFWWDKYYFSNIFKILGFFSYPESATQFNDERWIGVICWENEFHRDKYYVCPHEIRLLSTFQGILLNIWTFNYIYLTISSLQLYWKSWTTAENTVKCEGEIMEVTLATNGDHEFKYLLDSAAGMMDDFFIHLCFLLCLLCVPVCLLCHHK